MAHTYTRQDLYDLVWSEPLRTLCTSLGVSDVAVKKICKKADIPTPPQGYWNKVHAGKKTTRIALLPRGLGQPDEVIIGADRWGYYNHDPMAPIPPEPTFDDDEAAIRKAAAKLVGKVLVPNDFSRAHPLVRALLNEDEQRDAQHRALTYYSSWNRPRFVNRFDRRRLKVANGLLLGGGNCGVKWSISSKDDLAFVATVGSQHIGLKVAKAIQKTKRQARGKEVVDEIELIEVTLGPTEYQSATRTFTWKDADDVKVESFATEIVNEVFVEAEFRYREHVIHHHQWLIKRQADEIEARRKLKEEAERLERERQAKLERERIDRLMNDAEALRRAGEIRDYVTRALAAHRSRPDRSDGAQLERWREWALAQADRIDPVLNGSFVALSAELLGNVAPSNIPKD